MMNMSDSSLLESEYMVRRISSQICAGLSPQSALDVQTEKRSTSIDTGFTAFDNLLLGGVPIGSICEVYGPPGIGKSQFCLSVVLNILFKNSDSRKSTVVYFDTEMKFDVHRFAEMAFSLISRRAVNCPSRSITGDIGHNASDRNCTDKEIEDLLGRVLIRRPATCQELLLQIESIDSTLIENHTILVVIDSISSLARKEGLIEADTNKFILKQVRKSAHYNVRPMRS